MTFSLTRLLPLLLVLALIGCTTGSAGGGGTGSGGSGAERPTEPAVQTVSARWDGKPDGRQWTSFALEALDSVGQNLVATVPADVADYCPSYAAAGTERRKAFWVGLLSALAKFESNYDPSVTFREPDVLDAQGNHVISRGLLQISIESGRGYGCTIPEAETLHDPKVNLSCAVRIFNRLVPRDGRIASAARPWRGAAAYWSPFRRADRKQDMQNWVSAQSYCTR